MFVTKAIVLALATVAAAGVVEQRHKSKSHKNNDDITVEQAAIACGNENKSLNCCSGGDGGDGGLLGTIGLGEGCSPINVVAVVGNLKEACTQSPQCCDNSGKEVGLINASCARVPLL